MSVPALSLLEGQKRPVSDIELNALADILNVSVDWLLGRDYQKISKLGVYMEQKIKQNLAIGENIRKIRKAKNLGQTDLVRMLQIDGCDMTRECLVKIERCTQHIQATQLKAIKKAFNTTYDALIDGIEK